MSIATGDWFIDFPCDTDQPEDHQPSTLGTVTDANTPDLRDYEICIVNSSAGKDSQATLDVVATAARAAGLLDRLVVVHADLGDAEWDGVTELAAEHAAHYGLRFEIARRERDGQVETILDRVEQRRMWPDAARALVHQRPQTRPDPQGHDTSGRRDPRDPHGRRSARAPAQRDGPARRRKHGPGPPHPLRAQPRRHQRSPPRRRLVPDSRLDRRPGLGPHRRGRHPPPPRLPRRHVAPCPADLMRLLSVHSVRTSSLASARLNPTTRTTRSRTTSNTASWDTASRVDLSMAESPRRGQRFPTQPQRWPLLTITEPSRDTRLTAVTRPQEERNPPCTTPDTDDLPDTITEHA